MPIDTPLHKASHNGDLRAVQTIIDEASQIEEKVNAPGAAERRPLHRAAGGNHTDVVSLLIKAGAKVDVPDKAGRTALHWASVSGHEAAATILLDSGANVMATTSSQYTPLHMVAENGRARLVPHLTSAAGDNKNELFQATEADGKTAAALAKDAKHKEVLKALKDSGDPNASSGGCVIL